ncbi:MAG: septum formation initiator family protein [Actinobacteria bacterium]|jgi:cell division protein FtsB|nr:septum formation initiator family protein [Actinomycetota bacterium]
MTTKQRQRAHTPTGRRRGRRQAPAVLQRAARRVVDGVDRVLFAGQRAVRGDRPLVLMLLGAMALSVLMLAGPAQRYLDSRERVESLDAKAGALERANADLEQRQQDLQDPTRIELLAREHQGFIRPGEVPYTLIPPEVERPRITAPRDSARAPTEAAWYERVWARIDRWADSS